MAGDGEPRRQKGITMSRRSAKLAVDEPRLVRYFIVKVFDPGVSANTET